MTGLRCRRDLAHRAVLGRGVVLGDDDQRGGQCQADDGAGEQRTGPLRHQALGDEVERHAGEQRGHDHAFVEGVHDLAAGDAHEEGADDGGDDRGRAQRQRIDRAIGARILHGQAAEQHGGDDGDGVGLEQIGSHAGAVADIVTDVVGDDGRVARIILRDAGLDLAHQVRAHVGALGEDAAAETREDRDQRAAEGQAHQRVQRRRPGRRCGSSTA